MGGWQSTTRGTEEPEDQSTCSQYRYPPKVGNYFSTHFIMGGEKFDSPQPESFLFGDNSDLNFLGSKPVPFPYPPPQANEPTKTLKALINIRRDSLHFVKVKNAEGEDEVGKYNIVFTLDSDVRSNITIFYLASEEVGPQSVVYTPKQDTMCSPTYIYRKGSGQMFSQPDHIFQPGLYDGDGLDGVGNDILPVVIHCVADEGEEPRQSHITIGVIDKNSDGTFALKTLKQKLFVDGLCYLLQEIYGVERKGVEEIIDGELDDSGAECVVCMCDNRDTLILPCRHLCLCNACADSLRYQANNCPICRAPFRALLQIRALQKTGHSATHPALAGEAPPEGVPPGYEIVSLVEALNGPFAPPPPPLQLTDEGKKKKQKRRASVPHGKDGKKSVDKTVFPPVEEIDPASLPPPPSPPPNPAAGDVTIVNEKKNSARSITKSKSYEKEVGTAEEHKITLEVLSQDSVLSGGSDIVEEELQKVQEEDVPLIETEVKDEDNPSAEAEEDLENDKDHLKDEQEVGNVQQDKLIRSGVLCSNYSPEFGTASDPEDVDEDLEDVEEDLEDEGDDDVEDDDVEVVSLRGLKQEEQLSLPGTPRSGNSIRSSQESSTSVNSTNQLLGRERREGDDVEGSLRKEDRKKRGKSSIVPEADEMA